MATWKAALLEHFPEAAITGYESHIDSYDLPDPDDRHVLAAAVVRGVQEIVTSNIKDFPKSTLEPFGLVANSPNSFANALYNHDPSKTFGVIDEMSTKRGVSITNVQERLSKAGVTLVQEM